MARNQIVTVSTSLYFNRLPYLSPFSHKMDTILNVLSKKYYSVVLILWFLQLRLSKLTNLISGEKRMVRNQITVTTSLYFRFFSYLLLFSPKMDTRLKLMIENIPVAIVAKRIDIITYTLTYKNDVYVKRPFNIFVVKKLSTFPLKNECQFRLSLLTLYLHGYMRGK